MDTHTPQGPAPRPEVMPLQVRVERQLGALALQALSLQERIDTLEAELAEARRTIATLREPGAPSAPAAGEPERNGAAPRRR